ncbi:MAG: hypothetical protein J07HN4v3_01574 [Halonotius sp. J07HN4]|jgi:hypothetical protein|nr:MAG: hypothetical protein J07HN4v3_01574 [Halonotius sp. J07HN4]
MKPTELPLISTVVNSGTDDPVFQVLLLIGPIVIAVIVLFGRSAVTTVLAGSYLAVLIVNTLRNGVR